MVQPLYTLYTFEGELNIVASMFEYIYTLLNIIMVLLRNDSNHLDCSFF